MMHLPPETLLDGVLRTLREIVAPAVQDRYARGQVFAVLDVLNNLRDRVEEKASVVDAESASAAAALDAAVAALDAAVAAPVAAARAAVPDGPPAARAAALRAAVVAALDALATLPDDAAPAARTAIAQHMAQQLFRDLALLKPSLLEEISKG
jgi:hypothetical protein